MDGLASLAILLGIALLLYGFRKPLLRAFRRFDAANAARAARERQDRSDRLAHFRHALDRAQEELEDVAEIDAMDEKTGLSVKRYVFLGEYYGTREEAEEARRIRSFEKTREYYAELEGMLLRGNKRDTTRLPPKP